MQRACLTDLPLRSQWCSSLLLLLNVARNLAGQTHSVVFASPLTQIRSGKEVRSSSLFPFCSWDGFALGRASRGYHPQNRATSPQLDPAGRGLAPTCPHSNLYVAAEIASQRRTDEGRTAVFLPISHLCPVPKAPPIFSLPPFFHSDPRLEGMNLRLFKFPSPRSHDSDWG